jgi:hypothetical protein
MEPENPLSCLQNLPVCPLLTHISPPESRNSIPLKFIPILLPVVLGIFFFILVVNIKILYAFLISYIVCRIPSNFRPSDTVMKVMSTHYGPSHHVLSPSSYQAVQFRSNIPLSVLFSNTFSLSEWRTAGFNNVTLRTSALKKHAPSKFRIYWGLASPAMLCRLANAVELGYNVMKGTENFV